MADAAAVSVHDDSAARQAVLVGAGMLTIYVLWGSVYVAVRVVVEHAPPLMSIGLRYVVAGTILGVIALVRRGPGAFRISGRMLLGCAFLAIMLPVLTNGTVTYAVSRGVTAGPAALLSALVPISVVVIRIVAGEHPRRLTVVGVLVGFSGLAVLLLGGNSSEGFPLGPSLIVVFSANCWALGSYLQPHLVLPSDTFVTVAFELVLGGLMLSAAGQIRGEQVTWDYPATTWIVLGYLTASSTIAFTTYVWLLDHAPISLVSTHAYVNPVIAVALAWLLLSEPLTWPIVVGGTVVVFAVVIVIRAERVRRLRTAPDAAAEIADTT